MPDDHASDSSSQPHRSRRTSQGSGERRRSSRFAKLPGRREYAAAAPITAPVSGADAAGAGAATPLQQFRTTQPRVRVHPLEQALLWVVGAHLVLLPWALGTMRLWAQVPSLLLAVASLVLALVPRDYTTEYTAAGEFRLVPWPKLLRFPIFWLGLALLGLIVVQALNPAWEYRSSGRSWWMQRIPSIAWLPSGVRVPFEYWGPWRALIIYSAAWLTTCAVWIGFTRRRTVQRLFVVLAINGLAVAVFGMGQRIVGVTKIFGFVVSPNSSFFSSFIYKNHAGAYLNLTLAVAAGLGAWYYVRGVRRLEKSNPSGLFAFFMTCIAASILVSYARGATFVMLAYLCVIMAAFVLFQFRMPKEARNPIIAVALVLLFGYFLKTGLDALHSELAWDRLRAAMSGSDLSVEARRIANKASLQMLGDHWGLGTGSGSFGFLFPVYQQHFPEIFRFPSGMRMFWEHAHNDLLEIPIELGLPGVLILLGGFVYWAIALLRTYAWQNPLTASVIVGCLFLVGMASGDFVFECPAVLITWCALWPACTLWARLEEQRAR